MTQTTPSSADSPEIRSRIIKLSSTTILVLALATKIYLEGHPNVTALIQSYSYSFVPHLLNLALDALLIASVTFFLAETRLLKSYVEERVHALGARTQSTLDQQLSAIVRDGFSARVLNVDFLRQFDQVFLKQAAACVRRAFFMEQVSPEVDTFLNTLESVRETLTVWRTDYRVILNYSEIDNWPLLYCLDGQSTWSYVNYSHEPQNIVQSIVETPLNVASFSTDLYTLSGLKVGGEDCLAKANPKKNQAGNRTIHEAHIPITIAPTVAPKDAISLAKTAQLIQRKTEPWLLTFFIPVHTFKLSLHHPKNILPRLYVFGISHERQDTDPFPPIEETDTYHRWEYPGWLLPNHGVIVTFVEI